MKRLILHIGSPKTGSSFIQRALFHNKEMLKDNAILYSPINSYDHCKEITNVCLSDSPKDALTDFLKNQYEEAKYKDCDTLIISSECLLERPVWLVEEINQFVKDYELEVIVIIYIRNFGDYFVSAWQQWFHKDLKYNSFSDFVVKFNKLDLWQNHLESWCNVSPSGFKVVPFQKTTFKNNDLLCDFLEQSEVTIAREEFNLDELASDLWGGNISFNSIGNWMLFELRTFCNGDIHDHTNQQFISEKLSEIALDGGKQRLSIEQAWIINERNAELRNYLALKNTQFNESLVCTGTNVQSANEQINFEEVAKELLINLRKEYKT